MCVLIYIHFRFTLTNTISERCLKMEDKKKIKELIPKKWIRKFDKKGLKLRLTEEAKDENLRGKEKNESINFSKSEEIIVSINHQSERGIPEFDNQELERLFPA